MAFLAPALPAIAGALASGAANALFNKKGKTDKEGANAWDTVQTDEQREAYSKVMDFLFKGREKMEAENVQKAMPIPDQAHLAMNILPGFFMGKNFAPQGPFAGGQSAAAGGGAGLPPGAVPSNPANPWVGPPPSTGGGGRGFGGGGGQYPGSGNKYPAPVL